MLDLKNQNKLDRGLLLIEIVLKLHKMKEKKILVFLLIMWMRRFSCS